MSGVVTTIGKADSALDQRLSDELDRFNATATPDVAPAEELTVRAAFENEARERGCTHVFVTSFTFQAPGFYQRLGYEEIFRWEAVPTPGRDDVHLRREL